MMTVAESVSAAVSASARNWRWNSGVWQMPCDADNCWVSGRTRVISAVRDAIFTRAAAWRATHAQLEHSRPNDQSSTCSANMVPMGTADSQGFVIKQLPPSHSTRVTVYTHSHTPICLLRQDRGLVAQVCLASVKPQQQALTCVACRQQAATVIDCITHCNTEPFGLRPPTAVKRRWPQAG